MSIENAQEEEERTGVNSALPQLAKAYASAAAGTDTQPLTLPPSNNSMRGNSTEHSAPFKYENPAGDHPLTPVPQHTEKSEDKNSIQPGSQSSEVDPKVLQMIQMLQKKYGSGDRTMQTPKPSGAKPSMPGSKDTGY